MKKIFVVMSFIALLFACNKKETGPDYASEYVGKYDNGVLLVNNTPLATPSQAIVTHTVSRKDNSTLQIETEIRSVSSTNLANTGKSVLRVSSTVIYGKQTDPQWIYFESEGGFVKAYFRKLNNVYNLNIGIIQNDGTKIDNTVTVRN